MCNLKYFYKEVFMFNSTGLSFDNIAQGTVNILWCGTNLYIVAVELRFLLNWFLNINPYFEPFLSLWLWTNPVFCFGRSFYPKIFGWDPAPLINFQVLYFIQAQLGKFLKNLNDGLPPLPIELAQQYQELAEDTFSENVDFVGSNSDMLHNILGQTSSDVTFSFLQNVEILSLIHI